MLEIARKNVKGVIFHSGNMTNFKLKKKFDIITCLFSSIGYARTLDNLEKTIKRFSEHLNKGGVVIIEPWLTKKTFIPEHMHLKIHDDKKLKFAKLTKSYKQGALSLFTMHYLYSEWGKKIEHVVDEHELGLFEIETVKKMMKDAGLSVKYLKKGLISKRGLYIGVKK